MTHLKNNMKKFKLLPALTLLPITVLTVTSCNQQPTENDGYSTSDFDYLPSINKHPRQTFELEQTAKNEYRDEILANPEIFIQDFLYDKASTCKESRDDLYDEYGRDNVDASFSITVKDLSLRSASAETGEYALVRLDGTFIVDSTTTIREIEQKEEGEAKVANTDVSTLQITFTNMLFNFTLQDPETPVFRKWWIWFDSSASNWKVEWSYLDKNVIEEQIEGGSKGIVTEEMFVSDNATTEDKIHESEGLLKEIEFNSYHFKDVSIVVEK